MKQIAFAVLLFSFSSSAIAGPSHNPAEYTITVHVVASRIVTHNAYFQQLSAVIDGKNYELESRISQFGHLVTGDYKAKLVDDRHKPQYDVWQVYEFLFPDDKTRQFIVMEMKP